MGLLAGVGTRGRGKDAETPSVCVCVGVFGERIEEETEKLTSRLRKQDRNKRKKQIAPDKKVVRSWSAFILEN